MTVLLDRLLEVFAEVRNLRLRARRGLATRPEALQALSVLEVLDEPHPNSGSGVGSMGPLIRAVREILDGLPDRAVGVVWRDDWQEGEPDVVVVVDDQAERTTLVAGAHVTAKQLRQVAAEHLDTTGLVAFADCHHRHADGLEHRHHELLHVELEAAQQVVTSASGLRERTAAVEALGRVEQTHRDAVDSG